MESISSSKDFSRIFKYGRKVDQGPIRLWFFKKPETQLRVCFIGRSKKAVNRNRIRRRLKEGFRVHYYSFFQHTSYDFIFMSDERLIKADYLDIIRWMGELLEKAGVMNEAGTINDI